jgi:hypothetical protein
MGFFNKNNLGDIVSSIRIDLELEKTEFENCKTSSQNDLKRLIEFGEVCGFAYRNINGPYFITDKGYLVRFSDSESEEIKSLPFRSATLNLNENYVALYDMKNALERETKYPMTKDDKKIIMVYDDNGETEFVNAENSKLYLHLFRENISARLVPS